MKMETLPELWPLHDISFELEKDRWLNHTLAPEASENKTLHICAKHIEDCKVGIEELLVQNFGQRKDFGSFNYQIQFRATIIHMESSGDDFDCGAFSYQANYRDQLPQTGSSTTTQSLANGSWSQTDQSWQGHWQNFGWRHSQDLWDPSAYNNWRWRPQHKRIIHGLN